jgi:uncharacterized protein
MSDQASLRRERLRPHAQIAAINGAGESFISIIIAKRLTINIFVYTINIREHHLRSGKTQADSRRSRPEFADAEIVLSGRTLTVKDNRREYGEERFQTVGFLNGRMVMVVWTPRGENSHIISMRKCNDKEQARYQKRFEEG